MINSTILTANKKRILFYWLQDKRWALKSLEESWPVRLCFLHSAPWWVGVCSAYCSLERMWMCRYCTNAKALQVYKTSALCGRSLDRNDWIIKSENAMKWNPGGPVIGEYSTLPLWYKERSYWDMQSAKQWSNEAMQVCRMKDMHSASTQLVRQHCDERSCARMQVAHPPSF